MTLCIVGNGIIGMMTAYALSERAPGLPIKIIGPKRRTGCASLAAAAMFNSFCEIEAGTLANPMERARFLFNRQSNHLWPVLLVEIAEVSGEHLHCGFGTFLIRNTTTDELEDRNFEAILQALREFSEPHEFVAATDIRGYKPVASKRLTDAVRINNEGWVNPVDLIRALDVIVSRRDTIEVIDADCESISRQSGRVTGVRLSDGRDIPAQQVLACNGAEFTNLMNRSGMGSQFQRIFYGIGCTLVLECGDNATENCIRTPNRGLACGLYTAPQTETEVVVGASNYISPVPEHEARIGSIYTLLKNALEQINTDYYKSRLVRANNGWRPTSPDTLPLIGPTSVEGLIVATGTKRDGLHCSPVIAQYLSDLVISGTSETDMEMYRPERPLTRLYSREAAIEKYVKHTINAQYQHDFIPPKNKMVEELEACYRAEFAALHDKVGATEWGIPIEMKDMYKYGHIQ